MQPGGCHNIGELSRLVDPALSVPANHDNEIRDWTSDFAEVLVIRASTVQRIIPVIHQPKLLAANRNRPKRLRRTWAHGIWTPCGSGYLSLASAPATEHNAQKLKIVRSVAIAHKRVTAAANQ